MTLESIARNPSPANPKTQGYGGLLTRIERINSFDPSCFVPFYAAGQPVGHVRKDNLDLLRPFADVFRVSAEGVSLAPALDTYDKMTQAVAEIVPVLEGQGAFTYASMNERYPVVVGWGAPALFEMERNATIFFGLPVFGVHVNGYFLRDGQMHVWMQVRSKTLRAWPGLYDQMAAGGQPVGISVGENMFKEIGEEARLPRAVAKRAVAGGAVSYAQAMREGVRRDTLFVFDLELPEGIEPRPDFEEVEGFESFPASALIERICDPDDGAFKPNAALVLVDFFIRRGFITPDDVPDYCRLLTALRRF